MSRSKSLRTLVGPSAFALGAMVLGATACLGSVDRQYVDDKPDALDPNAAKLHAIGGAVDGMAGTGLVLQNNGGDDLTINASGAFAFTTKGKTGDAYDVKVLTQPTNPAQGCAVSNGKGTIGAYDVSDVAVSCSSAELQVGGTVSGLAAATSVVMRNNGGDDLAVSANGAFKFPKGLLIGSAYSVTVFTQPNKQTCTVDKGTGTLGTTDVTDVAVACGPVKYSIGGTASGVVGSGLSLLNSINNETLPVSGNGAFTFVQKVAVDTNYAVDVATSPAGQKCTVTSGSGTATGDVTNITASCEHYQGFDTVVAPALPAGWTTTFSGGNGQGAAWKTVAGVNHTVPNSAFAPDPDPTLGPMPNSCSTHFGEEILTSPAYPIQTANGQITFRHSYGFEDTFDGGVLEIAIPGVAGGAFQDIIVAGGSFVGGGYAVAPLSTCCGNPLAGRVAWTGASGGFAIVTANLPATAMGKSVTFRWRLGFDGCVASTGWNLDTISIKP